MQKKYILAFDQGTTSTRAIVYDENCVVISQSSLLHEQIYQNPGWVSHNANEIYDNIIRTAKSSLAAADLSFDQIAAIGISNQRETVVAWDAQSGEPIYEAIVWQCRRTSDICEKMRRDQMTELVRGKTGLIIDPYFSATKIKWIIDNIPAARACLGANRLRVGTIDSYIIWRLTCGRKFVTDYTNASRTMLFNITTLEWDAELLAYFDIPREILPEVVSSSGLIDETDVFGPAIPITGVAGDQHASLFGQTCFDEGDVKNTYGTGCFILKNIGDSPIISKSKLLTTIAWSIGGQTKYALEGSIFNAGAAFTWLINEMRMADDVAEINHIFKSMTDSDGVYIVPAFSGLGAPYWDMYARGTICGMTLSTNREHIVRATVEAVAFQTRDVLDYMYNETGMRIRKLSVDGGVSQSNAIMQFQADILNTEVERPADIETTSLGAAYMAGLAIGFWKSIEEIKSHRSVDITFRPSMPDELRNNKYEGWLNAVDKSRAWISQR